jgi:riboflavin transporter FmnP
VGGLLRDRDQDGHQIPFTSTMMVGELTDLVLSSLYVIPAVLIYGKVRNLKGVAIAFGVSTFIQMAMSMVLNVYVLIPFYIYMMGFLGIGTSLCGPQRRSRRSPI